MSLVLNELVQNAVEHGLQGRPGTLELTATTQDIGQAAESLDAKYEGAEMVVAFNPDYLSAGVDAVISDEVVLETERLILRPYVAGDAPAQIAGQKNREVGHLFDPCSKRSLA